MLPALNCSTCSLLLSIIINRSVYTTEVNIIDLHGTKSLDQLVLENELDENENNNYDLKDENISLEEISNKVLEIHNSILNSI